MRETVNALLLGTRLARLQAFWVAGLASEVSDGLVESVRQHGQLATVAQRAGGTARATTLQTALGILPTCQINTRIMSNAQVNTHKTNKQANKQADRQDETSKTNTNKRSKHFSHGVREPQKSGLTTIPAAQARQNDKVKMLQNIFCV